MGIILNVEKDHTDYFKDLAAIRASFRKFAGLIPESGCLVAKEGIGDWLTAGLNCRVAAFGDGEGIKLAVPGAHNQSNAAAALAAAGLLGVNRETALSALARFEGANRRFQRVGYAKTGAEVIDDYAHHPTEIKAALEAAKAVAKGRVWCAFQSHTKERTKEQLAEFAESLQGADELIVLEIYSPAGREGEDVEISGADLAERAGGRYRGAFAEAAELLEAETEAGDMIVVMGAGDVVGLSQLLINR